MLDRDRPGAAAKRGASLVTRLGAVSRAGSRPPRLAQMRRHHALSALGSRLPGESRITAVGTTFRQGAGTHDQPPLQTYKFWLPIRCHARIVLSRAVCVRVHV